MPKILVADDDEFLRGIYVENFKQAGFEVLEAKDGLEALNLVTANKPDVIFTGIMMPKMTGFEFLQAIKESVETTNIPFVIFSHLGREEDRQQAEKLGAKAFFVKGLITPKEIIAFIQNLLTTGQASYKVAIDMSKHQALELLRAVGASSGSLTLELTPEDNNTFKARLI